MDGVKIKDAQVVSELSGTEKMPISDGSNIPKSASVDQLKEYANNGMATTGDLKGKQDKIEDLEDIRSGAAKGATAIQEHQDISGLATKESLEKKQDVLVSGENIKTVNGKSLLGSGNIVIEGGSGGGSDLTGYATEDWVKSQLEGKVNTEDGKGLSTNDYTDEEKQKLNGISENAEANVQSDWNVTDEDSDAYIKNKPAIPGEVTEETVSEWGFTKNTGDYTKPTDGIPKSDLSEDVQASLGKADTALQSYLETDPVFSKSAAAGITSENIDDWNSKTANEGTITGIKMNGEVKGTNGEVDLGTVITEHQDISHLATNQSVDEKIASIGTPDLSEYAKKSEIPVVPTEVSAFNNDAGYMTETDIEGKQDKVMIIDHGTDDTTFELTPNMLHKWGTVTSLTLTLATPADTEAANYYMAEFVSGDTATTLSVPESVKWVSDVSIESGKTYQISILNGCGVIGGF